MIIIWRYFIISFWDRNKIFKNYFVFKAKFLVVEFKFRDKSTLKVHSGHFSGYDPSLGALPCRQTVIYPESCLPRHTKVPAVAFVLG